MIDDFHGSFSPLTALEYEDIVTDGDIGCAKDGLSKKKNILSYWLITDYMENNM